MINKIDINTIKIGQKVKYGFFSNITFEGFDDKDQVILKDKNGNIKKVYRTLFEKNGVID